MAARLLSLDAFPGWTTFWIVGGTALLFGLILYWMYRRKIFLTA